MAVSDVMPADGTFSGRLAAAVTRTNSLVCVGLDPDPARFPPHLGAERDVAEAIVRFNAAIIAATKDIACAYKPNLGFYAAHGVAGITALEATRHMMPPDTIVILDAKVGDMATTSEAYARGYLDRWAFDALTVNPYQGAEALAPFFQRAGRGIFVLCKTSNPRSGELQDLDVVDGQRTEPLHLTVAARVATWDVNAAATLGLVVGATHPRELAAIRARCPDLPILLPGVGAQGGDIVAAVRAGLTANGDGLLVASSRAIIHASSDADFAESARADTLRLRDAINAVRERQIVPV